MQQSRSVRRQIAFGATYQDLRDDLLFNFEHISDVNLFVKIVRHELNYAVHVTLSGRDYIEENSKLGQKIKDKYLGKSCWI
jgi:hypothetical protein